MKHIYSFNESILKDESEEWDKKFLEVDKEYRRTRSRDLKTNYYSSLNRSFKKTVDELKDCFLDLIENFKITFKDQSSYIWSGYRHGPGQEKLIYTVRFTFIFNTKNFTEQDIEDLANDYRTGIVRSKSFYDVTTKSNFHIHSSQEVADRHNWSCSNDFDWDDVKYLVNILRDKAGKDFNIKIITNLE
jgi:hypothetical protein